MKEDELVSIQKKHAETINLLAENQRVILERVGKLENRDVTADTELAINKAVEKIVLGVSQQTTSVVEPTKEPVKEPIKEPVKEPVKEPTTEPVKEPVKEPATEPVKEPTTIPQ